MCFRDTGVDVALSGSICSNASSADAAIAASGLSGRGTRKGDALAEMSAAFAATHIPHMHIHTLAHAGQLLDHVRPPMARENASPVDPTPGGRIAAERASSALNQRRVTDTVRLCNIRTA